MSDDDLVGVGSADIVEEMVGAADDFGHLVHVMLDDGRALGVKPIDRLAALKIDVRVLLTDFHHRPFRIEGTLPEFVEMFRLEELSQSLIGNEVDFLDFARGPEAVEEMKKRDLAPERGEVRDDGQVLNLLDRSGRRHGEARIPGGHDVGMVAEDRQALAGQRTGRDVKNRGKHFARDLMHVREHEHQPLRRGEGRGQGAGREGAVDRARGARLRTAFR